MWKRKWKHTSELEIMRKGLISNDIQNGNGNV